MRAGSQTPLTVAGHDQSRQRDDRHGHHRLGMGQSLGCGQSQWAARSSFIVRTPTIAQSCWCEVLTIASERFLSVYLLHSPPHEPLYRQLSSIAYAIYLAMRTMLRPRPAVQPLLSSQRCVVPRSALTVAPGRLGQATQHTHAACARTSGDRTRGAPRFAPRGRRGTADQNATAGGCADSC